MRYVQAKGGLLVPDRRLRVPRSPVRQRGFLGWGPAFLRKPSSGAFTPLSLYSGGIDGAWFDPSDFATMFQDTAATIPVTTAGQSVALIRDKSGNAHHASQATAATRPTIQQDASGNWYLSFNGSQYLDCGTGFNATTFYVCVAFNAGAANQRVLDARGTGPFGTLKGWYLKGATTDGTNGDGFAVDDGTAFITDSHVAAAGTNHVGYFDHVTSSAIRYELEGGSGLTTVSGGPLGSTTSTATSRIGAASNNGTQGLVGREYGIVVVKSTPTADQIANLRAWMAGKCGVSL